LTPIFIAQTLVPGNASFGHSATRIANNVPLLIAGCLRRLSRVLRLRIVDGLAVMG
jgi:hypothetical protein